MIREWPWLGVTLMPRGIDLDVGNLEDSGGSNGLKYVIPRG